MSAVVKVYRWEMFKLLAQKRTYLGLGAAMLVPVIFVVVLLLQSGGPNDVPLGRYVRETGLVAPFLVLFFMSIWGLPLITALVAGDIVAAESHNGTLKTIFTRSRERGQIFAAKVLASFSYVIAVVFAMGLVGFVAGSLAFGFHPLTSLSGTKVSAWHGLVLLAASLGVYVLPLAGVAAFGLMLSTVTRNSAASVVGTLMFALLMQLLGVLPGTESFRPYLLGTQFDAWHGFLRVPGRLRPGHARGLGLCALHDRAALRRVPRLPAPRRRRGLVSLHAEGLCRRARGRGGRAPARGARARGARGGPRGARGRLRLDRGQAGEPLSGLGGRGRPRCALRLGRGLGHHGCPQARSVMATDASVFRFRYN